MNGRKLIRNDVKILNVLDDLFIVYRVHRLYILLPTHHYEFTNLYIIFT